MKNYDYPPELETALFLAIETFYASVNDAVDKHTLAHHLGDVNLDRAVAFMLNQFHRFSPDSDLNEMANGMVQAYDRVLGEVEEMAIRASLKGERETECLTAWERN